MYLGVDIGSSSSKAAILDEKGELKALAIKNLGTGTNAYEEMIAEALKEAGVSFENIKYTVATGYGRMGFRYMEKAADKQITEISCHAKGASYFVKGARTIVDIGGQDAKIIRLTEDGRVENFVMNEKCAAGTGRFIEVMARVLAVPIGELSALADKSRKEIHINNTCTVFAESEVISRLAGGEAIEDVARGAHVAIAKRVAGMCQRVGYSPKVVMTGGVALNPNLVDALSRELKTPVEVVPHCQGAGAVGAACYALELANS